MTTAKALAARWESDPELSRDVAGWLAGGPRPDRVADVEGRADLRGYRLGESGPPVADGAVWNRLDLRRADLRELAASSLRITDCLLDQVDARGSTLWGAHVSDSSLAGAKLAGITLAAEGDAGCRWQRVDFAKASIGGGISGAEFTECSFAGARLRRTEFLHTVLSGCGFEGARLDDCRFLGLRLDGTPALSRLKSCDLAAAELRWVEFDRCEMSETSLPHGFATIPTAPEFAAALIELLGEAPRERALGRAAADQRGWPPECTAVFAADRLEEWTGLAGDRPVAELLESAARAVGTTVTWH